MILKQDFSANVAKTLNLEHNVFFLIFEKIFIDNKSFWLESGCNLSEINERHPD